MLAVDDFPDSLFGEEHSTLEGPCMVRMIPQSLDAVAASVRIFG